MNTPQTDVIDVSAASAPVALDERCGKKLDYACRGSFRQGNFEPVAVIMFFSLLAFNLLCFSNALSGYFHADDIWHVQYAYQATHGNPELLLKPFYSEWLSSPSFPKMYRPIVPLSEAIDCLFWGMNPLGYHLSNILFHSTASFMLFLLVRRLFMRLGNGYAQLVAIFSAVTFSVYPMHAEVVAWITERFDSLCTVFFLASFWLFLVMNDAKNTAAGPVSERAAGVFSLALFACSLACKEMSLTLPVVLFAYSFILGENKDDADAFFTISNISTRLIRVLRSTVPYVVVAALYLFLRLCVTGTLFGTYGGAAGAMLQDATLNRLLQWSNLWLPLLPVNEALPPPTVLSAAVRALLAVLAVVLIVGSLKKGVSGQLAQVLGFLVLWAVICIIPALPVLSLQSDLAGSRHFYMSSAPLCVLIVVLLTAFSSLRHQYGSGCGAQPGWVSIALLVALVSCYALLTYHNNKAWEMAGVQMKSLVKSLRKAILESRPEKSVAVVDVPLQYKGAHMIYDLESLHMLLRPPYCNEDISSRLDALEPTFYNHTLISPTRLDKLLRKNDLQLLRWNTSSAALEPVPASRLNRNLESIRISAVSSSKLPDGSNVVVLDSNAPARLPAVDVIELGVKFSANHRTLPRPTISLLWASDSQTTYEPSRSVGIEIESDAKEQTFRLHVSRHEDWALAKSIPHLRLLAPPNTEIESLSFACLPIERLTPSLSVRSASPKGDIKEDSGSVYRSSNSCFSIAYEAGRIPGAVGMVVEVSSPGGRLDLFHYGREDKPSQHAMTSWREVGTRGTVSINSSMIPEKNVYQVRAAAVDSSGRIAGYFSDPVFLALDPKNVGHAKQ